MGMINLVFDIDGLLACTEVTNVDHASFFMHKGVLLTAIKTHYVFPGVIELMQLVFQTEGVRVSFFSSGEQQRNDIFVEKLLTRALGKDRYEKIKPELKILSAKDLDKSKEEQRDKQYRKYKISPGHLNKDISKVLRECDSLHQVVLIEDDKSYIAGGQAENVLLVPETNRKKFEKLPLKSTVYTSDGFAPASISLVLNGQKPGLGWKREVKNGTSIILFQKNNQYEVGFLNTVTNRYEQRTIPKEENADLIAHLDKVGTGQVPKEYGSTSIDEHYASVSKIVLSFNGKVNKIRRASNRIYYLTGLLFTALERAKVEKKPITEILFSLQFKQINDRYKPKFRAASRREELYLLGLEKLRTLNPSLSFITPQNYIHCIKLPRSPEQIKLLQEALAAR